MIDSQMPIIVAHMLIGYYQEDKSSCLGLSEYISKKNPLSRSKVFYTHKIKEMLSAVALGMKPATEWDGTEEASGGYIIVKTNGDVLARITFIIVMLLENICYTIQNWKVQVVIDIVMELFTERTIQFV